MALRYLANFRYKLTDHTLGGLSTYHGTPDWIRTSGLQSRSLTRYPTAPRAHTERYEIFSLPAIRGNSSQTVASPRRFSPADPPTPLFAGPCAVSQPERSETSESDALSNCATGAYLTNMKFSAFRLSGKIVVKQ